MILKVFQILKSIPHRIVCPETYYVEGAYANIITQLNAHIKIHIGVTTHSHK